MHFVLQYYILRDDKIHTDSEWKKDLICSFYIAILIIQMFEVHLHVYTMHITFYKKFLINYYPLYRKFTSEVDFSCFIYAFFLIKK